MTSILLIFLGGGIGAVARYGLQGTMYRMLGGDFPYGTLVVNVVGCFLIGVLMMGMENRFLLNPSIRVFLTIGILGGFTTFSSFSYETIALLRDGQLLFGLFNVFASIVTCLLATYLGTVIAKLF
ncbi:MAG: fluoride efflux transporter CrcB [Ignavibacteriae bacterium]|nr:fluoride efflux transporter CrcB [Ignavibacteriota bacterium]